MAVSRKTFDLVKGILRNLDEQIDSARQQREGVDEPTPPQDAEPARPGRARPLRRTEESPSRASDNGLSDQTIG